MRTSTARASRPVGHAGARVLVVDRYALFRAALRRIIDAELDMESVAEAADGSTAARMVAACAPNVVVVDAGLLADSEDLAAGRLLELDSECKLLFVGESSDPECLVAAVQAGADGYVTKDMSLSSFVTSIRWLRAGEAAFPRWMVGHLVRRLVQGKREAADTALLMGRLTRQERVVLRLLSNGCTLNATATALYISPETARSHIQHVLTKLGVHSRAEAVALAVEHARYLTHEVPQNETADAMP